MEGTVYTLGAWRVKAGQGPAFIETWRALGIIFRRLPNPPSEKGTLVQSLTDSSLFYSFGPWPDLQAIQEMRGNPEAVEGMKKLRDFCVEASPGNFRVVAEA
jgi:hypothetical protein